jgi:hypothetical protein
MYTDTGTKPKKVDRAVPVHEFDGYLLEKRARRVFGVK